jgi:hypothetical protein
MKRLSAAVSFLAMASACLAQGTVSFNINAPFTTPADRLVYDIDKTTPLVGLNYSAGLFFLNPTTSQFEMVGDAASFRAPTTSVPGTWNGGTRNLPDQGGSLTYTLEVRVWDNALFGTTPASYGTAFAAGGITGRSDPFSYTVPPAGSPPAAFFMENLRSFALVPEPSTIAFGLLGLVALALRGRK